jgi:hypothetical protein
VQRTVNLDSELESELTHVADLTRVNPASLLVQAVREGLPVLAGKLREPRPEGYFAADYAEDRDRVELEATMAHVVQGPER